MADNTEHFNSKNTLTQSDKSDSLQYRSLS